MDDDRGRINNRVSLQYQTLYDDLNQTLTQSFCTGLAFFVAIKTKRSFVVAEANSVRSIVKFLNSVHSIVMMPLFASRTVVMTV